MSFLPYAVAAWLFVAGLYGVALLLALVMQAHKRFGTLDPDKLGVMSA